MDVYMCMCVYIVSFAFKLVRVYATFIRKTSCRLVTYSWPPSLQTLRGCVSPILCLSLCCPAVSYPSSHSGGKDVTWELWLLVSVFAVDHDWFFFRWMVSYPSFHCSSLSCGFLLQPLEKPESWPRWARPHPPHWWVSLHIKPLRRWGQEMWRALSSEPTEFSRCVHIGSLIVSAMPSPCIHSVASSWTDVLFSSTCLQISQGDRKLLWFH